MSYARRRAWSAGRIGRILIGLLFFVVGVVAIATGDRDGAAFAAAAFGLAVVLVSVATSPWGRRPIVLRVSLVGGCAAFAVACWGMTTGDGATLASSRVGHVIEWIGVVFFGLGAVVLLVAALRDRRP